MGKNFDQVLDDARQIGTAARVHVTFTTHQGNGIVSYARGILAYSPPIPQPPIDGIYPLPKPEHLFTETDRPLQQFFSDRLLDIDPPDPGPGPSFRDLRQPFSANNADKLGLSISPSFSSVLAAKVRFRLESWGNAVVDVALHPEGNLLLGFGPPIGDQSNQSVYVISFGDVYRQPDPPR